MNIKDIEDFRLSDAVEFHSELNPLLFTDDKLQKQVRDQLMIIAHDFVDFMGIQVPKVVDVRLYGSNAAYTYTKHSDIDLHILVDMATVTNDEVYLELFNSKKKLYNDTMKITVRGQPVELYMQNSEDVVRSLGDYSVLHDRWVKMPTRSMPSLNDHATREKFKRLVVLAELALRGEDLRLIDELLATIRRYRQAGLEEGGEFSPENFAVKALRSRGILDKLYDYRDALKGRSLSIDEALPSEPAPQEESPLMAKFRQFKVTESFDKPYNIQWEKGDRGDWDALAQLPDGSPLSIMFSQRKGTKGEKVVEVEFYRNNSQEVTLEGDAQRVFATVLFAMQQYIKKYSPPTMVFGASKLTDPSVMYEPGEPQPNPESRAKLYDRLVQRYAKDWGYRAVRSGNRDLVIYELSRINKEVAESSGHIPSHPWKFAKSNMSGFQIEQAYWARQSRLIESGEWSTENFQPYLGLNDYVECARSNKLMESESIDQLRQFQKYLTTLDGRSSVIMKVGSSISVMQFTPLSAFNTVQVTGFETPKKIKNINKNVDGDIDWIEFTDGSYFPDSEFHHDGKGGEWSGVTTLFFKDSHSAEVAMTLSMLHDIGGGWSISFKNYNTLNESSGYIPSKAERNDPRFKMALSVDVDPNIMPRQAKALALGPMQRDGRPQVAKTSGKFTR